MLDVDSTVTCRYIPGHSKVGPGNVKTFLQKVLNDRRIDAVIFEDEVDGCDAFSAGELGTHNVCRLKCLLGEGE
jgi:hypothetical protein